MSTTTLCRAQYPCSVRVNLYFPYRAAAAMPTMKHVDGIRSSSGEVGN